MERRFEVRKQEILKETDIQPEVVHGMLKRLEQFTEPFVDALGRRHLLVRRLRTPCIRDSRS